ncbi:general secretion pathway protein GspA [Photobacterium jeanii]|uniref:General secretion pathway protein GspA n=1 Tax=Photobacterium jeanii TaxID=858640 RepID=A0A178KQI0_9GAMM|nr:ExeA family protein [Photobacterium jeanii]OAN19034.1 general secretion pathway protein GspA [Photobacterium jeanii]PST87698.1 general secretion pathway protein GspA [Photobacterium jeanii]
MYKDFFGITEVPFSIVPSARFLYLSDRHREALTHLLNGLGDGGGFGLLTGEVGTGKTTVLRALIARLTQETQVAVILNPTLSAQELLASVCDELGLSYADNASYKVLMDTIYQHLLLNHSEGRQTLLLIDEAQHLMPDVLEQLRLLTNLETESRKLLKVVLIGQPELQQLLQQERLRQLAQRITSRYHLLALTPKEVAEYIQYRLRAVDCLFPVFDEPVALQIAQRTQGIPRLINLVCDKAMQLAYQHSQHQVTKTIAHQACDDVLSWHQPVADAAVSHSSATGRGRSLVALGLGLAMAAGTFWAQQQPWFSIPGLPLVTHDGAAPATELATADESSAQPVHQALQKRSEKNLLSNAIAVSRSEQVAMQTLYQLWGYDTSLNQANCTTSQRLYLSCYQGKGKDLSGLTLINRPALVGMHSEQDGDYFAVLYHYSREQVELLLGGQRIAVSHAWFEQHWEGNYTLLWRPPLGSKASIRFGQRGERVDWLNQQLSQILGEPVARHDKFDQKLLDKLRRFQRAQNLAADGIAGPMTLMVIDAALNLPGPTLLAKVS